MTVDEFLDWDPHDPTVRRWQLVDGEPVAMAPGSENHASLQNELGALLRNHLLERGSACRALTEAGVVPRAAANWNFRIPDLLVTCAPPGSGTIVADPVLVVEILSPSNEIETRGNIWAYTTIPSVREILAVRSTRIEAELLRREPDGSWPGQPVILGPGDTLTLASIDFVAPLRALYRTTVLG
jgi:Uma2 family endonuclease